MILRRYGTSLRSVDLDFDSRALTEIGFRRNHQHQIPVEEFEAEWEQVDVKALEAGAEGWVQDEVESLLLDRLAEQVVDLERGLGENELLVIESEQGVDYPKTRDRRKTVPVEGENRLHFTMRVEPPLRIGIYRRRR